MHHIYHTEGLVLGGRDVGESGRRYAILTRELGLVYAQARGVRQMSSKLRYILQDFACVQVDLVQGKHSWRIGSAIPAGKLENIIKHKKKIAIVAEIASLLRRLLTGTEENVALFDELVSGLHLLENTEDEILLPNVEAVIVLRLLGKLGYIGESAALEVLLKSPLEAELIRVASRSRQHIIQHINRALRESHL